LQLIDVREPQEYEQGGIEGATLIPLGDIKNRLNELNKANPLVLYCRSGRRSQQAQKILVEHGFKNTINLEGGIMAWNDYLKKER
jgi:adenylyltransferase/sulfurtransferase